MEKEKKRGEKNVWNVGMKIELGIFLPAQNPLTLEVKFINTISWSTMTQITITAPPHDCFQLPWLFPCPTKRPKTSGYANGWAFRSKRMPMLWYDIKTYIYGDWFDGNNKPTKKSIASKDHWICQVVWNKYSSQGSMELLKSGTAVLLHLE